MIANEEIQRLITQIALPSALRVSTPGFEAVDLAGTVGETSISGTLDGSGFVNLGVTLERQP